MQIKRHAHTEINSLKHIQYKRWQWKQANEPRTERPFKGSKSAMAVTSMGIKTTSTTTTTAAKTTAEQSSRQAAGVWSSTHACEWEVGWTSTWPQLWMSDCASVCLSVLSVTQSPCFPISPLPVAQPYLLCLFVCLTWHPFNYLSACLSPSLHPFLSSRCLPVCLSAALRPSSRDKGGGWVGGW